MSGGDGNILADVINKHSARVKEIGPIGEAEGIEPAELERRLEAVRKLIPYLKLVERQRLRVPEKTAESYKEFWESEETNQLFDELIGDKLAIAQIMLLLEGKSLSTGEISEALGLNPSAVSKHMNSSARQGLVKYDVDSNCYALA